MRTRPVLLACMVLTMAAARAEDAPKPCTTADQPLRPVLTTHTQPPYPPISEMTNEEGVTTVGVSIGSDGVPTNTSVTKSSGSLRLDQSATDFVKSNWRWTAPVINCRPTAAKTQVDVTWHLKKSAPVILQAVYMDVASYPPDALKKDEQGTATVGISLAADGTVGKAILYQSSGFPDLDTRSVELARSWHWVPANLNGRTLDSVIYFRMVWRLADKK